MLNRPAFSQSIRNIIDQRINALYSGRMQKFIYGEAATPTLPKSTLSCDLLSGKSGPKDQVALHYYCSLLRLRIGARLTR